MNSKEYYDYWNTYAQNNYNQVCYNQASRHYDHIGGYPSNNVSSEVKIIPGSNYAGRNYQQTTEGVVHKHQQWNQNQQNPDVYQIYHQTQIAMQHNATLQQQPAIYLKKYKEFHQYGQYSPSHNNRVYDMPAFPSPKSDKCSDSSSPELKITMDKKFLSPVTAPNQPKLEVHTPPSSCRSDDSPALRRLLTQPKTNHSPPPYFVPAPMNNSLMHHSAILEKPKSEAMELDTKAIAETTADLGADLDAFFDLKLDLKTDEAHTSNQSNPKKTGQDVANMSHGLLIYQKEAEVTSRQSQNSLPVSNHNLPMSSGGKRGRKRSPALVDCKDPQNAAENGYFPWMKNIPNGTVKNNKSSKRSRQTYTRYQTLELEKEFFTIQYLTRRRRIDISHGLSLTERQIKIWFQNRRMKAKKDGKLKSSPGTNSSENVKSLPSPVEVRKSNAKINPIYGGYANNVQMNQPMYSVNTAPMYQQNYANVMCTMNQPMYSPTMDSSVNTPPLNQSLYSPTMDASGITSPINQPTFSPTMGPSVSSTPMYSPTMGPTVNTAPMYSPTMGPTVNTTPMYSPTMAPTMNTVGINQPIYSPTTNTSTPPMNQQLFSPTPGTSVNSPPMSQPMFSPTMGPSGNSPPTINQSLYSPTLNTSVNQQMYSSTTGPSVSTVPMYSSTMGPTANAPPMNLPRYSPTMCSSVSSAPMNQAMFSPPLGTDAPDNMNGIYGMGVNLNHMQGMSDSDITSDYRRNQ